MSSPHHPDLADAPAPAWRPDDEGFLCVQVIDETPDVRTFVLRLEGAARSFHYRPGQFVTLALEIDGERVNRCYTLSSSPTRPDTLAITVKRVPGGRVSNWLHDHLRPGTRLDLTGPAGAFCFPPGPVSAPARGQLYLSGGSGITPLMSMSRAWADLGLDADVHFVHAARTPQDVVFAEELTLLARRLPRWRATVVCEQRGATPGYSGLTGRLSLATLRAQVPDLLTREVWCCGPAPFMAAVRAMLGEAGFDMARYHEESFSFEASADPVAPAASPDAASPDAASPDAANTPPAGAGAAGAAAPAFAVRLAKGGGFDCAPDETLLQASRRAGLRWPFSCASGVCGSCRTRRLAGEVLMQQGGGLRPREVAQGWILPCCSRPLSDVALDR
ncbi:hybrid-cluster NAD(P)-dependent oxidoreductase [Ideonella livida]|uniref:Hybrid-cluster NAD(P)-dependent oxidoreductase n=1 Tax=Ideonella livida TaxID=2707176 RepID=A0A7C9PI30_9BURK|nr:hybrid-cluster NAD(P)-dependent oxidoreductase [Ideonella livida]NDY91771.1 hybrid-cluster NAD(P)-dependent oxidoreductase [Ideonella livida]